MRQLKTREDRILVVEDEEPIRDLVTTALRFTGFTVEADVLAQELLDYEIKVSEDANNRYGAFKVGAHDDLVTALGLAAQGEKRRGGGSGSWLRSPDDGERGLFPDHDPWRL